MLDMETKLFEGLALIMQSFGLCKWDYTIELDQRQGNSVTIRFFKPTGKGVRGSGNFVTLKITTPSGTEAQSLDLFEKLVLDAAGTSVKLNDSQLLQTSLNLNQNNQNLI